VTRAERIYRALYDLTGGAFSVFAFHTRMLRPREGRMLGPTFQLPDKPPGVCLGFKMSLFPVRVTAFNKDGGQCDTTVEERPVLREEWATIVQPQDARRALDQVMEVAYQHALLLQLRATGRGDTV
jgi:hypothetical protein